MAIVGGLDIHRRQITFDTLDTTTGETRRGQLSPASRLELRPGWHSSAASRPRSHWKPPPAGATSSKNSPALGSTRTWPSRPTPARCAAGKRRAKTDRTDAHHLRELLRAGTLPESWMPPAHIADARTQVRLRHALVGARTGWYQRLHAIVFHHGLPDRAGLLTGDGRAWLARVELPAVARQAVDLALRMIDQLNTELDTLDAALARIARGQPGCKALMGRYGIGWLTSVAIWAWVRRRAPLRRRPAGGPLHRVGYHRVGVR